MKNLKYLLVALLICCALGLPKAMFATTFPFNEPKESKHVVFLISEDPLNYEAHLTVPPFAEMLDEKYEDLKITVLKGEGTHGAYRFPNLEILKEADLLVVFCRRLALPFDQMTSLRNYLRSGKPMVGLRTANHGFSVRDEVEPGFEGWWGFVPDILGCENNGYYPEKLGTIVTAFPNAEGHPILANIDLKNWKSKGQVYKVKPIIDPNAVVLLNGKPRGKSDIEPIAWTRTTAYGGKVFYTSLGYPTDFKQAPFIQLLINSIHWALEKE
tara:strand:+ start:309 stop:1118 length:810 start_codon:yes stop_codon:yes gene_type:complete